MQIFKWFYHTHTHTKFNVKLCMDKSCGMALITCVFWAQGIADYVAITNIFCLIYGNQTNCDLWFSNGIFLTWNLSECRIQHQNKISLFICSLCCMWKWQTATNLYQNRKRNEKKPQRTHLICVGEHRLWHSVWAYLISFPMESGKWIKLISTAVDEYNPLLLAHVYFFFFKFQ